MDQVRKALAWLKQYHFWVLSVLVVLIGLFCWWSASGTMSKLYAENQTTITSGFKTVGEVKNDQFHPNANIQERQLKETSELSAEVAELWQKLYDAQRENVLKWPSELKTEFHDTVEKLEFGQEIPDDTGLREHYQNYIARHFPKLPEKIGARAIDEAEAGTLGGAGSGFSRRGSMSPEGLGGAMGGELDDDGDYICEWAAEDQAAVRAELEFPQTPSSLRIWCTQENIWVYHTLLDVIKNTNEAAHATRMSNAAVRGIYSLQVGQPAAPFSRTPNRIYKLPTAAPATELGPGDEQPMPGSPEGIPSEFSGGREFTSGLAEGQGEMSPEQEFAVLFSGRYLGEDGKPVPAGGGGAAVDPNAPADSSVPSAPVDLTIFGREYKRLPVRMVLEMDQRHLPRLIAECAIRPLQIEVQEVRVNAPDIFSGAGGGGGMSSFRGGFSEGGGMGAGNLIPDLTGLQEFNPHPEIVTVAVQGVIYIFNKPNKELLTPPSEDASLAAQTP